MYKRTNERFADLYNGLSGHIEPQIVTLDTDFSAVCYNQFHWVHLRTFCFQTIGLFDFALLILQLQSSVNWTCKLQRESLGAIVFQLHHIA